MYAANCGLPHQLDYPLALFYIKKQAKVEYFQLIGFVSDDKHGLLGSYWQVAAPATLSLFYSMAYIG
jgi:hypothetical protein